MEGPVAGQIESAHDAVDEGDRRLSAIRIIGFHEHRWIETVRLHIVHLETEPLKADEIMHRPPDGPRHRDPGHHAQENNFFLSLNMHGEHYCRLPPSA